MRISDWSSDVCSSDLQRGGGDRGKEQDDAPFEQFPGRCSHSVGLRRLGGRCGARALGVVQAVVDVRLVHRRVGLELGQCLDELLLCFEHRRSEEHTSELQSLMRISYAVFCLKTKTRN